VLFFPSLIFCLFVGATRLQATLLNADGVTLANHASGWFSPHAVLDGSASNGSSAVASKGLAKRDKRGKNVVFIKVAKAGGTTLQELLQR